MDMTCGRKIHRGKQGPNEKNYHLFSFMKVLNALCAVDKAGQ